MDIEAFIRAEIDADEAWALACSVPPVEGQDLVSGGVHWQWVRGPEETPIPVPRMPPDDTELPLAEYGTLVWLATKETWPVEDPEGETVEVTGGYSAGIHDLDLAAAASIARYDPARVLAGVATKRALLELVLADQNANGGKNSDAWNQVMRLLALEYRDRPEYRKAWAPR